ncbi:iron chaperone [Alkalihalobacillus pseudalcaliphilus]|uniref:iron chaperone n=1 Tax=Alkalihalobacillus pseudalcaliphilus TaxID=79884 RepID=UPI00064DEADE|nr:iron chaperone [Alkalihalobacillus pseudalcaliphilus]KMK74368.1 iron chaperone [Alkalihalobacillus pseudalcaliphilus]
MDTHVFTEFLEAISNSKHRSTLEEVFHWIAEKYPYLEPVVKWNQPMFTDHGTYIIGFSVAKQHLAVAPEEAGMNHVAEDIEAAGHSYTKGLVRLKWSQPIDYALLEKMIEFNVMDKADCTTFWRA